MSTEFMIGETAWHTEWKCLVKIAGPLELWPQHVAYGELVDQEVRGHRVLRPANPGGPLLAARPCALRKIQPMSASCWDAVKIHTGWRP